MAIREYKSNMFSMLLQEPEYALEIYNALNNSNYENEDDISIFMSENGISLSIRNDASFLLDCSLNIYEQQSSVNPNMPLRHLIYVTNLFQQLVAKENLYGPKLIRIPNPKFVVFYNGKQYQPEVMEMRLSDAFFEDDQDTQLELKCVQYNINPGYNESLKKRSPTLLHYIEFCEAVKKRGVANDKNLLMKVLRETINDFISRGILKEFLEKHGDEVIEMETLDYTFERRLELERRDAIEEGHKEGHKEGFEEGLNLVNRLAMYLSKSNRMDDLNKSFTDRAYQQQLIEEMLAAEKD